MHCTPLRHPARYPQFYHSDFHLLGSLIGTLSIGSRAVVHLYNLYMLRVRAYTVGRIGLRLQ